jgi:hypothetical protein
MTQLTLSVAEPIDPATFEGAMSEFIARAEAADFERRAFDAYGQGRIYERIERSLHRRRSTMRQRPAAVAIQGNEPLGAETCSSEPGSASQGDRYESVPRVSTDLNCYDRRCSPRTGSSASARLPLGNAHEWLILSCLRLSNGRTLILD